MTADSSDSETSLRLAADEVDVIVDELALSNEARERAREMAERADFEHPINRTPEAVAAGAVYLAGCLVNEKQTQEVVADAAGVHTVTVRNAYRELAECEGFEIEDQSSDDEDSGGRRRRVRRDRTPVDPEQYRFSTWIATRGFTLVVAVTIAIGVSTLIPVPETGFENAAEKVVTNDPDYGLVTVWIYTVIVGGAVLLVASRLPDVW